MRKLSSRLLDKSLIAKGVSQSRIANMSDTEKIELLEEVTTVPTVTFDTSVTPITPEIRTVGMFDTSAKPVGVAMPKIRSQILDKLLIAKGVSQSQIANMSNKEKMELLEVVTTVEPTVTVVGPITIPEIDSDDSGVDVNEPITV